MPDNDPLSAALKRTFTAPQGGSYFPAVRNLMASERGDLLKETESTFYGGGQAPTTTPTPSPSPVKPTQMNLAQLYDHFGVPNPFKLAGNTNQQSYFPAANLNRFSQTGSNSQMQNWQSQYGWNT